MQPLDFHSEQRSDGIPVVFIHSNGVDHRLPQSLDPSDAELYREVAVIQDFDNWQRFQKCALPGIKRANASAMDRLSANYALPSPQEDSGSRIRGPTMIIAAKHDHIVGYEDQRLLADRYPNASFHIIDFAGHNLHLDQPVQVHALLKQWSEAVHEHFISFGENPQ